MEPNATAEAAERRASEAAGGSVHESPGVQKSLRVAPGKAVSVRFGPFRYCFVYLNLFEVQAGSRLLRLHRRLARGRKKCCASKVMLGGAAEGRRGATGLQAKRGDVLVEVKAVPRRHRPLHRSLASGG